MTPALEFLAWRFLSCNNVKSNPRMTKSVHCGIPYVVNKNKTMTIFTSLHFSQPYLNNCLRMFPVMNQP